MPFDMEVGFGPGHIVLAGEPAPPKRGTAPPPTFRPMFIVAKRLAGWLKVRLGTKVGLGPGNIVFDADPAPPRPRDRAPSFRFMSIVAKRSRISATAEHLFENVSGSRQF